MIFNPAVEGLEEVLNVNAFLWNKVSLFLVKSLPDAGINFDFVAIQLKFAIQGTVGLEVVALKDNLGQTFADPYELLVFELDEDLERPEALH